MTRVPAMHLPRRDGRQGVHRLGRVQGIWCVGQECNLGDHGMECLEGPSSGLRLWDNAHVIETACVQHDEEDRLGGGRATSPHR